MKSESAMPPRTPVAFVGLGPIGRSTLAHALFRPGLEIVAACDPAPAVAGKPLDQLVAGAPAAIRVAPTLADFGRLPPTTVAILCTQSHIPQVAPTIEALVRARLPVVASCEELVHPQWRHPEWAAKIDALAREHGVAVLGTGVNPGYVLDLLPALLSGVALRVDALKLERVVDAATRRGPLQQKVGAGKTPDEFRAEVAAGRLGHVGLPESAALLCEVLRFGRPRIRETLEPVVAKAPLETAFAKVAAGRVAGLEHRLVAEAPHGRIDITLQMYLGAPDPHDLIELAGEPPLKLRIEGGTPGDLATVAALLNAAPAMRALAPGLRNVIDGPFPLCRALA
jgi:4-hydroxy-tetrahydrodipicolinate reductase